MGSERTNAWGVDLTQLRDDFMEEAFNEGKRVGILQDGVYHVPTDVDMLCMHCGGMYQ